MLLLFFSSLLDCSVIRLVGRIGSIFAKCPGVNLNANVYTSFLCKLCFLIDKPGTRRSTQSHHRRPLQTKGKRVFLTIDTIWTTNTGWTGREGKGRDGTKQLLVAVTPIKLGSWLILKIKQQQKPNPSTRQQLISLFVRLSVWLLVFGVTVVVGELKN